MGLRAVKRASPGCGQIGLRQGQGQLARHLQCRLVAQNGHASSPTECLLSGVKRT